MSKNGIEPNPKKLNTLVNISLPKTLKEIQVLTKYHQIPKVLEDKEKTTFVADEGTFYYKVISFGLKNTNTTY